MLHDFTVSPRPIVVSLHSYHRCYRYKIRFLRVSLFFVILPCLLNNVLWISSLMLKLIDDLFIHGIILCIGLLNKTVGRLAMPGTVHVDLICNKAKLI